MRKVSVPEYAIKELDALIHSLYSDNHWWRLCPDYDAWIDVQECDKTRAKKAKKVAKAFGLYPYNQDEVRCP
jgi:hypothetical protein